MFGLMVQKYKDLKNAVKIVGLTAIVSHGQHLYKYAVPNYKWKILKFQRFQHVWYDLRYKAKLNINIKIKRLYI